VAPTGRRRRVSIRGGLRGVLSINPRESGAARQQCVQTVVHDESTEFVAVDENKLLAGFVGTAGRVPPDVLVETCSRYDDPDVCG
jgi:hypothetical protein